MKLLIQDFLRYADITNETAIVTAPGHPITNIQDSRLSRNAWIIPSSLQAQLYGISLYGENPYYELYATEQVIIDFDLKAIQIFDTFALAGNNFGVVNITLSWAEIDISSPSGSISFSSSDPLDPIVIPTGVQSARYFRITIGSAQPDGNYLLIGRVALGIADPLPDIRPVIDIDITSTANRTFSDSMQLYGGPKVVFRQMNISFPEIDDPANIIALFTKVDMYNPVFLFWDEPCSEAEKNLYCALTEPALPLNRNDAGFYTSRLSFREVF